MKLQRALSDLHGPAATLDGIWVDEHMSIAHLHIADDLSPTRAFLSINPMGRFARAEKIAGAIVYLCLPAAAYMKGAEVVIDGGTIHVADFPWK